VSFAPNNAMGNHMSRNSDTMKPISTTTRRNDEAGFTLSEALVAMLILMFGLASIFNLMIVATSSNSVANRASAATMIASQELEVLRSTPYSQLVNSPADSLDVCTVNYCRTTTVEGVGTFESRWLIQTLTSPNLRFLQVRTQPNGFRGISARADLTTIRACTLGAAAGCL
jgi:Tfp pilus assembly protein PilV